MCCVCLGSSVWAARLFRPALQVLLLAAFFAWWCAPSCGISAHRLYSSVHPSDERMWHQGFVGALSCSVGTPIPSPLFTRSLVRVLLLSLPRGCPNSVLRGCACNTHAMQCRRSTATITAGCHPAAGPAAPRSWRVPAPADWRLSCCRMRRLVLRAPMICGRLGAPEQPRSRCPPATQPTCLRNPRRSRAATLGLQQVPHPAARCLEAARAASAAASRPREAAAQLQATADRMQACRHCCCKSAAC